MSLEHRLTQLEQRTGGPTASFWDVITGEADFDALDNEQRTIVSELWAIEIPKECPIEAAIAAVQLNGQSQNGPHQDTQ